MTDVVSVVGCGPSALKCGAERAPGYVIAVNDAFRHVRHDAVLSMDGRWAKHRFLEAYNKAPAMWLRGSAFGHIDFDDMRGEQHYPKLTIFDCDTKSDEFGSNPTRLNGGNSGYCAINLAFTMTPRTVYLFGFDYTSPGKHFHPESEWSQRGEGCTNTPRKFAVWSVAFQTAREYFDRIGCKVINTNRNSAVRSFKFGDAP